MYQLSSNCKLPDKSRNLAVRQAQVWRDMPHNIANYNALANVLIENQYVSFGIDDTWNGTARCKSDDRSFSHTYEPSMGYMPNYWPTQTPVMPTTNGADARVQLYNSVDPVPQIMADSLDFSNMPRRRFG